MRMAIKNPSDDSIMAVLRTEMRDRPVRLAFALLLFMAAALLMPSAEVDKSTVTGVMPTHRDWSGPEPPVPACLFSVNDLAADDAKTTLVAKTQVNEGLPFTPPSMTCFPKNPKTTSLFR